MDLIFALLLSFTLLLISVFQGYFIAYPLFTAMVILMAVLMRRGFSFQNLLKMAFRGSQKSFSVLTILLLIGIVTAVWMAAGTVPAIVYYGIQLIQPQYFILATFILSSFVSLLLGTSFGTVSTIGIALMIMAKGSGVNPHLVAGAIIAGAYVGDRCSPMSSSANLIAIVTQTKLYTNIQNMWKTALLPLFISVIFYSVLSLLNPVQITDQTFTTELRDIFQIHWIDLLPAIAILFLAILQIEVKLSMLISVITASAIALFYQHYSLFDLLKFALVGFSLENATPLHTILLGGGLLSMVKVSIVVIISTAFVGIFAETHALHNIEGFLEGGKQRDAKQFGSISPLQISPLIPQPLLPRGDKGSRIKVPLPMGEGFRVREAKVT
ncbi:MAG: Na+/H+ antiporter NhaC family protein, partial [Oculatellaceae cyanobacterium bins.114]|nr:Na+/H+ antiporter NhaC family protein [Oculatellaceae cyanobacterium bins.114]